MEENDASWSRETLTEIVKQNTAILKQNKRIIRILAAPPVVYSKTDYSEILRSLQQ